MVEKDNQEKRELKLLGFTFTKFLAQKNPDFKGKLDILSNINILSLEKQKLDLINGEAVKINFDFTLDYKDSGKLEILGNLMLMFDAKTQKQVLEEWKDKKLPNDIRLAILNIILQRSSLKALQLEEEVGLPLHVQLPRLKMGEQKS